MSLMPSSIAATNEPQIEPSPPTDDHDQHIDQIGEREGRLEADNLDRERAAEAGEPGAEREGQRERAIDVDAEPARHALVIDRGAHLLAEAGKLQRQHEHQRDCQPDRDRNRR